MHQRKTRKKADGSREILSTCTLCGSKGNMETNSRTGLFHCWSCHHSGKTTPPLAGTPDIAVEPRVVKPTTDVFPDYVFKEWESRNLTTQQVMRYNPTWNGSRVVFPVVGGPSWERSVWPWDQPKVLSFSPKGLLGLHLVKPGDSVVLVEGDYKAVAIPHPWVGVAIGGKSMTDYQLGLLEAVHPGSITVMLDGGEEQPSRVLVERLHYWFPQRAWKASLPVKKGPDDVSRDVLINALLEAAR